MNPESQLIGSALILGRVPPAAADVSPDAFEDPVRRDVWAACLALGARGEPVDVLSVSDAVKRASGRILGDSVLLDMVREVVTVETVAHYAGKVREAYQRRRFVLAAGEAMSRARGGAELAEVYRDLRVAMAELESTATGGAVALEDAIGPALDTIGARLEPENDDGVPTGFGGFDRNIGRLRPKRVIVVAGRPGMGKTAWAVSVIVRAAKAGIPCLLFSLEMGLQEMVERIVGATVMFSPSRLSAGDFTAEEYRRLYREAAEIAKRRIWVDERTLTVSQICAEARRWRAKNQDKRALVAIDYAGLVRPERRAERRELEVAQVSQASKGLAKELDVPVVLLAQLNRDTEREQRDPRMSDLRESGSLEQDADMVLFPVREMAPDGSGPINGPGPARLIVGKNRGGRTGNVAMWWNADYMLYTDAENRYGE